MAFTSDSIRVLKVIVETRSFGEAAHVLCCVPSAVSYTVKKMEEELGVALFDRSGKSAKPTPAALYILENSSWILNAVRDLKKGAYQIANGVQREYTIALNYIINPEPMSQLMAFLLERFPATKFSVRTEVYNGAWDALYEGRADMVIGAPSFAPVMDGIATMPMGMVEWTFVVGKNHPLAARTDVLSSNDIRIYPSLVVRDSSRVLEKKQTWALIGQKVITVANLTMVLDMIKAGVGVAFLPSAFVKEALAKGEVVAKHVKEHKHPIPVFFAWKNSKQSTMSEEILDFITQPSLKDQWLS